MSWLFKISILSLCWKTYVNTQFQTSYCPRKATSWYLIVQWYLSFSVPYFSKFCPLFFQKGGGVNSAWRSVSFRSENIGMRTRNWRVTVGLWSISSQSTFYLRTLRYPVPLFANISTVALKGEICFKCIFHHFRIYLFWRLLDRGMYMFIYFWVIKYFIKIVLLLFLVSENALFPKLSFSLLVIKQSALFFNDCWQ